MGNWRLAAIISILAGTAYVLLSRKIDYAFHNLIKQFIRENNNYRKTFFDRFTKGSFIGIGPIIITVFIVLTLFIPSSICKCNASGF
jgi:hypothetical protein